MSDYIEEKNWTPVGIRSLENNAELAIKSRANLLVVAGPGSGKTELLAQRADFLLKTGLCKYPKKILSISFKRDAANNLEQRVKKRCLETEIQFDSMTLDGFAKKIVDRFLFSLPDFWRPNPKYKIRTERFPTEECEQWLLNAPIPVGFNPINFRSKNKGQIEGLMGKVMHGARLPYNDPDIHPLHRIWGLHWWKEQLNIDSQIPGLTFQMLNRLAAFLLRENPKLCNALKTTYSHVFMDEFQDTTSPQWDLICSAFQNSTSTILTAVGDEKQRIMKWAGAMPEIFSLFENTFTAKKIALINNYRSAQFLLEIQHEIAKVIDSSIQSPSNASNIKENGVCEIIEFEDHLQESIWLSKLISNETSQKSYHPRDYCILVRSKVEGMIEQLQLDLHSNGIRLRDESRTQDLLVEPLMRIILCSIRLATKKRDRIAWDVLSESVSNLIGENLFFEGLKIEKIVNDHRSLVIEFMDNNKDLQKLPEKIVKIIGFDKYGAIFRSYSDKEYFNKRIQEIGVLLSESYGKLKNYDEIVDDIEGLNVIPAMTIHKSKGLEFDTVIILGLEDNQWWNFRLQPEEERRAFFVALSSLNIS